MLNMGVFKQALDLDSSYANMIVLWFGISVYIAFTDSNTLVSRDETIESAAKACMCNVCAFYILSES